MPEGEQPPVSPLDNLANYVTNNPQISRRAALGIIGLTGLETATAFFKGRHPNAVAGGQLQAAENTPSTVFVPETTTTTTIKKVIPPPKHVAAPPKETLLHAAEVVEPAGPEQFIISHLSKIPRLEQLAQWFPNAPEFSNYKDQLAHLDMLAANTSVSIQEFQAYAPNLDFIHIFDGHPFEGKHIDPKLFVFHWTIIMPNSPQELAQGMMTHHDSDGDLDRTSVYEYLDDQTPPVVYRLIDETTQEAAHALGVNEISQGIEMKSRDLLGLRADQIKVAVMAWTRFCIERNLPVDRTTGVGHYEVDLLTNNPSYNPDSGTFVQVPGGKPPHVNKFDGPRELLEHVIIPSGNKLYLDLISAGLLKQN